MIVPASFLIVPASSPSTGFDRKVSTVSCEKGNLRLFHVLGQETGTIGLVACAVWRPAQSGND